MTKRADSRNISLGSDHAEREAALRALADALGLAGNLSALVRYVADSARGALSETAICLQAAQDRAGGGDEWNTLVILKDLLPPITLAAEDD